MKNLANCKPSEFLKQTNRIRKSVDKWLKATDIMEIRRRLPEEEELPITSDVEERHRIITENARRRSEQARQNLSDILDEVLEKHPDETLEVLALCCFVEPENVDDHPVSEYLKAFYELINDEAFIGFFSLLMQPGAKNSSPASQE